MNTDDYEDHQLLPTTDRERHRIMISYLQAIVLGALQGFAELFPISSLGHTVLVPALLGWHVDRSSDAFVAFLVLTHLATALVLVAFFWRDWLAIISGVLRSLAERQIRPDESHAKLGWLLVVSTIPAGLLGLLFEEQLQQLFADAATVAVVLMLNGVMLYGVEQLRIRGARRQEEGIADGILMGQPANQAAAHRQAGAGKPRYQCETLRDADDDGLSPRERGQLAFVVQMRPPAAQRASPPSAG